MPPYAQMEGCVPCGAKAVGQADPVRTARWVAIGVSAAVVVGFYVLGTWAQQSAREIR